MKEILQDIKQRLATVAKLKEIAEDWGQLQYDQPPVAFPCALIDVQSVNYSQLGNLAQAAEGTLTISVADDKLVARKASEDFATLELVEAVNDAIHGYSAGNYSRMIRVKVQRANMPGTIRIYSIVYLFAFQTQPKTMQTATVNRVVIN